MLTAQQAGVDNTEIESALASACTWQGDSPQTSQEATCAGKQLVTAKHVRRISRVRQAHHSQQHQLQAVCGVLPGSSMSEAQPGRVAGGTAGGQGLHNSVKIWVHEECCAAQEATYLILRSRLARQGALVHVACVAPPCRGVKAFSRVASYAGTCAVPMLPTGADHTVEGALVGPIGPPAQHRYGGSLQTSANRCACALCHGRAAPARQLQII